MSSLSLSDQAAIVDLVNIGHLRRRLVGFAHIGLDLQERVQARLLEHGYAAVWDGADLVIGRQIK